MVRRRAWSPTPRPSPSATVTAHGTVTTESMLASLSIDVTLAALEQRAGEVLMLHAAGLATDEGRVVVLVGPSGRGKTTASRVLGRDFGYVSDESVGIEADGTVLPYRKPLSIIEDHDHLKAQRSPTRARTPATPDRPLRVAALVLIERDAGVAEPRVERLDPAEGIVGLAEQASYLGRLPHPLRTLWSHVAAVGGVHRVTYSDAAISRAGIATLAGRAAEPRRPGRVRFGTAGARNLSGLRRRRHQPPSDRSAPTYRRVPVLDTLALDDDRHRAPRPTRRENDESHRARRHRTDDLGGNRGTDDARHHRGGRGRETWTNRRQRMPRPWSRHPSRSWSRRAPPRPTRRDSACRAQPESGAHLVGRGGPACPRSARLSGQRRPWCQGTGGIGERVRDVPASVGRGARRVRLSPAAYAWQACQAAAASAMQSSAPC